MAGRVLDEVIGRIMVEPELRCWLQRTPDILQARHCTSLHQGRW